MSDNKKIYQRTPKVPDTEKEMDVGVNDDTPATPSEPVPTFEEALSQDNVSTDKSEEVSASQDDAVQPTTESSTVSKHAVEDVPAAPIFAATSDDVSTYSRDNYGSSPKTSFKAGTHGRWKTTADNKKTNEHNRKPMIIAIVALVVVLAGILIGVGVTNAMEAENKANIEFYQTHIFDKTTVGGVDVSKLTAEEAAEKVNGEIAATSVTVVDGNDKTTFTAADAKVSEVPQKFFDDIVAAQDSNEWKDKCANANEVDLPKLQYDMGALESAVEKMDCVSGSSRSGAVDAQLKMSNGEFEIVPGKEGNLVDADMMTDLVMVGVTGGAYDAGDATSGRENTRQAEIDAVSKAKEEYKELRASFVDEDKDGWDDATDVIISDALAEAQAKIDAAQAVLDASKAEAGGNKGTYAGKVVNVEGVKAGGQSADIVASQYYEQPMWTGEEQEFQDAQDKAKKWLGAEIDYTIDMIPHAAKVDSKVIEKFIVINQDKIDVELDEDAIKAWLHETCKDYDTVGTERTFTTANGSTVTMSGGHYGWMTDEAAELPKLVASIEAGEVVSRDMSYEQEAKGPKGGNEIGNTYIDLDISAQTVSYVQNGSVVFSARTVTGNEDAKHETQRGYYSVLWKDSPHVMVGEIVPSTGKPEYETPCTYFILFNYNGSAFHDADHIRSNWSTSAHYGDGSHGCSNMHYGDVQELWGLCDHGDPVVVHD